MKKKGSLGYFLELAKKDGFNNLVDWNKWKIENGEKKFYKRRSITITDIHKSLMPFKRYEIN